jgi:uncharacterized protein YcfL
MKPSKLIYFLVLIFILSACKSNDDSIIPNENSVIPLSYSVIETNGSNYSIDFEYTEKLITSFTTDFGGNIIYNYIDDRLTAFQTIQNGDTITTNLEYENNRLIELRKEDNSLIISYSYNNSDHVISTEQNENGAISITFYEYDDAGNVITARDDFSTLKFIYNERNNPFKNVFPQIDAEITWEWFGSQINLRQEVQEKLVNESDFTTKYTYQYTFVDPNYFPTERRQLDINGNLLETVLYYYGE